MASGSADYWSSSSNQMLSLLADIIAALETGSDLVDKLDALDGTVDGRLTLTELDGSDVVVNLATTITRLNTVITNLGNVLTQITGVHTDTTAMIDYSSESWTGSASSGYVLVSSENAKRNMLKVTNTSAATASYSRDGSTHEGYLQPSSSSTVHDSPGFWIRSVNGDITFSAYEEWAT